LTAPDTTKGVEIAPEDLVAPPEEELAPLLDLALSGDISGVRQQAIELEQREAIWGPFARRLQQLATNLEDEQIIALLEQHMPKDT
jgi:hypothetical protein